MQREIVVDSPVSTGIGAGQRALGNPTANAEVVQRFPTTTQTGDRITETVHACELSEGHAQELIPARERTRAVVALIPHDELVKFVMRKLQDKLRKKRLTVIQAG